jgi:hypothetical protein
MAFEVHASYRAAVLDGGDWLTVEADGADALALYTSECKARSGTFARHGAGAVPVDLAAVVARLRQGECLIAIAVDPDPIGGRPKTTRRDPFLFDAPAVLGDTAGA